MKKTILAATALAFTAGPALADTAPAPPPQTPYYAPQAASCDLSDLTVYFKRGTAELTAYGRDVIREAREQLSGCAVVKLKADAIASDAEGEAAKLSLAEARRVAVMDALRDHGIRSSETDHSTRISVDRDDAVMARRVDISLKAKPAIVG